MFNLTKHNIELFWQYVPKNLSNEECWNWLGSIYKRNNRGRFSVNRTKSYLAYRIIYYLTFGEFNKNLLVCHKCDNPLCVNPNHLFLGTHITNRQDCVNKNRQAKHSKNGRAKLTEEQANFIRQNYNKYTNKQLKEMFDLDRSNLRKISKRSAWV